MRNRGGDSHAEFDTDLRSDSSGRRRHHFGAGSVHFPIHRSRVTGVDGCFFLRPSSTVGRPQGLDGGNTVRWKAFVSTRSEILQPSQE